MTDPTAQPKVTDDTDETRWTPESLLEKWEQDWNKVRYFAGSISFRVCPSLVNLASATSRADLKTASDRVLTTVEMWATTDVESQSYIKTGPPGRAASGESTFPPSGEGLPSGQFREKAYRVLNISEEEQEWTSLGDLAPHVRIFVLEKTREMENLLDQQPSATSARKSRPSCP